MVNNSAYEAEVVKIMTPVDSFIKELDAQSHAKLKTVQDKVSQKSVISIAAVMIIVVLLILCYVWLEKRIINTINNLVGKAKIITGGDLRQHIDIRGADELAMLGYAFNEMIEKLSGLLHNIQQQSLSASESAGKLNAISQQPSSLSAAQNEAIDVIASSVHENQSAVRDVAQNCNDAANAAQQAQSNTQNAQSVVSASIASVNTALEKLAISTTSLTELQEAVKDVTDILTVIDSIADQ